MDKCPTPVGHFTKNGKWLANTPCKNWGCEHCSKVKKYKILKRFEHYRQGGFRYRMMTLTEWKNPINYDNAKLLTKHWNRLRASLSYWNVYLDDYFWTKEYKPLYSERFMENALLYPHLHILVPVRIDTELVSRLWFKATGHTADNVHIPNDDDKMLLANPVAYMCKYLTKSDMNEGFSKSERRYGFSRNMPPYNGEHIFIIDGVKYIWKPYIKDESVKFKLGNPTPVMPPPTGIKPDIPDEDIIYTAGLAWAFNTVCHCLPEDLEKMRSWYPVYKWVIRRPNEIF